MSVREDGDDTGTERAFAVLMIVLSVVIFLAVRRSERSNPEEPGSSGRLDSEESSRDR